ncbi:MAG: Rrf2 family transcriptional regulator [Hyphomicrobiales bacterium]|nr:MAG: Rrf2 family transcriptional regulator [Hyphomicrobiales bacterium]
MRLTHHSNYAMRLLMYCALMDKPVCRIADVAEAYGISENHLTKIAQKLAQIGVIETVRGRNGGVYLAKTPEEINVGEIIRVTEENLVLVECFADDSNTCPLTAACRFKRILHQGLTAFLSVLDGYTLADLVAAPDQLKPLMHLGDDEMGAVKESAPAA